MPRFYSVLNMHRWPFDAIVEETGECLRCGGKGRPVLCVKDEDDELCLCQPCLTRAFEEADGYFDAFPEKPSREA